MDWNKFLYHSIFNEALKLEPSFDNIVDGEHRSLEAKTLSRMVLESNLRIEGRFRPRLLVHARK